MALTRLSLSDFRSYHDAVVTPGPGLNALTGENGAGKTNVLEAVSLLAPGRGLRRASLGEMARQGGAGGFAVAGRLDDALELTTGTSPATPERRIVRVNSAPSTANALAERLSVIWVTPAMDRLFADAAGGRRQFLDRMALALHPGHAVHAARYEAAMRARNRLLADERPDPAWLTALEARMLEHGAPLARARADTVTALSARLADAPEGPFARAALTLEGGDFANLGRERKRDAAAGRTLTGPHRQDLIVIHASKEQPAARCSTGEQKALLLGLVLAHAELVAERIGARPVLLLDEVAAHLDPARRAALFARLSGGGGQVWMTGTEPALFVEADAARFHVEPGRVERMD